jgi:hypothetical protein
MGISKETTRWLDTAGFCNYCFVSYPHTGEGPMTEFAEKIRDAVEVELRTLVSKARVYLDRTHIPPGAEWPEHLRENLGGSVAMIAVLSPIYLEEEHEWCGREWEAMARLGDRRFSNTPIKPIIPVFFRKTELPEEAGARQSIDLSRVSLKGRRYYSTQEFRGAILKIVDEIVEIAKLMHANKIQADVQNFVFPPKSPFTPPATQAPPLRAA